MFEVDDIVFSRGSRRWCYRLSVGCGEIVQLLGESGSGKTTLLLLLGGFLSCEGGHIRFSGKEIGDLPPERRPVASLFQDRTLFPHLTLFENVALALSARLRLDARVRRAVEESLVVFGIESLRDCLPCHVSGGQGQLAALARLWLQESSQILLLDEPLQALDPGRRLEVLEGLRYLVRKKRRAAILTTHAPEETARFTTRAAFLARERIVFQGKFSALLARKATEPYKSYFCALRLRGS